MPVLPPGITACLIDLDGVVTRTAPVHRAAWREMFDRLMQSRAPAAGVDLRPFETGDYLQHIDGKLRLDGVRSFLRARGIVLPEGSPGDPAEAETIHGLGARKNAIFLDLLRIEGVGVYEGSLQFIEAARAAGLRRAVVSSSQNCRHVLDAAGLGHLFEVRVDGATARETGLPGKPAPDMFLAAARLLGVQPQHAAVFEDAVAGVAAGRDGSFGWVVGVAREANAAALRTHGADIVVGDLSELLEDR